MPYITPNSSNGNINNEVQEFKFPLNKRNLKFLNKEAVSDIGSKVSMASNKTDNGHIKRHCELCGFKHIANWFQHKKKVHGGVEVPSIKCLPQCSYCIRQIAIQPADCYPTGRLLSGRLLSNRQIAIQPADCYPTGRLLSGRLLSNRQIAIRQIAIQPADCYPTSRLLSNRQIAIRQIAIQLSVSFLNSLHLTFL